MNEANTRAELIEPLLEEAGWGRNFPQTKIDREFSITLGKLQNGGRAKPLSADYVLIYKNTKLAVIEAKSIKKEVGEGVAQAKNYAEKMQLGYAFACNGEEIYQINMNTGKEGLVSKFPSPEELWSGFFEKQNQWLEKFHSIPFASKTHSLRFYQETAINRALEAIAANKNRILLTLATGTGKTFIASQIAWKLFKTRWNLSCLNSKGEIQRQPRILFLVDRNILADQAFTKFDVFPEDALVRIDPLEIKKKGKVPTNGSVFFTIFQTFMSGQNETPYFGEYPDDYFDFIIVDECHRGGANDESSWREILEYFSPAVQLGMTATPKRKNNVDTYAYFGEAVYSYSLKEGIQDGFLTPFKVKRIQTTIDEYAYASDDKVLQGEVDKKKIYKESEFNHKIEIKQREEKRVKIFLEDIHSEEKTIVFCANQSHAALIRDFINKHKKIQNINYCHRVTSADGEIGNQHLENFKNNEKTIPTILTTSRKLSTGVDARNIRCIVLLRPIYSIVEFKQIIGRGTRLFDGKNYFTIYDFVDAYRNFFDPEWDGEAEEPAIYNPKIALENLEVRDKDNQEYDFNEEKKEQKIKIKLADGKEREIQSMTNTHFFTEEGSLISAKEFLENLFGKLPDFFTKEEELIEIWSAPETRKKLLERLTDAGYNKNSLKELQRMINAEQSDLFDLLEYVSFGKKPITREQRANQMRPIIVKNFNEKQQEFLNFVLSHYVENGVEELEEKKLASLLAIKYNTTFDAQQILGSIEKIKKTFTSFQKHLYSKKVA